VVGVCVKWYQSIDIVCRQQEKIERRRLGIIPLRRCRERLVVNEAMEEEMRQICARLDAMETTQRRAPDAGDVSESENEYVEAKEVAGEQATEE
jgi:hypothetical protein